MSEQEEKKERKTAPAIVLRRDIDAATYILEGTYDGGRREAEAWLKDNAKDGESYIVAIGPKRIEIETKEVVQRTLRIA